MITELKNGKLYDPTNGKDGVVQDIYIRGGRIIAKPSSTEKISQSVDLSGKVVMAGAIDMHSHIGGGKINIARMMLPEFQESPAIANQKRISVALIAVTMLRQARLKLAFAT